MGDCEECEYNNSGCGCGERGCVKVQLVDGGHVCGLRVSDSSEKVGTGALGYVKMCVMEERKNHQVLKRGNTLEVVKWDGRT